MTVPPVVAALQQLPNPPEVDVLASKTNCQLLSRVVGIRRCLAWDAPWSVPPFGSRSTPKWQYGTRVLRLFARFPGLLANAYDTTLFLSFNPWEKRLLQRSAGNRWGFRGPYTEARHTLAEKYLTQLTPFEDGRHLLENCQSMVQAWSGTPIQLEPSSIPVDPDWAGQIVPAMGIRDAVKRKVIVIHPGHPKSFKSWPPSQFAELIRRLTRKAQKEVWIVASQLELDLQSELIESTRHEKCMVVACQSLAEFAGLAHRVTTVIANDGGPAHIAAAVGTPTVVLFGPTDERIYAPLGEKVRSVRCEGIGSAPCQTPWRKSTPCCRAGECLSRLQPEEVIRCLDELEQRYCSQ